MQSCYSSNQGHSVHLFDAHRHVTSQHSRDRLTLLLKNNTELMTAIDVFFAEYDEKDAI